MKRTLAVLSAVVAIAATGCQKDPLKSLTPEESRIYVTNHDSNCKL
jgi:hypothetical protein